MKTLENAAQLDKSWWGSADLFGFVATCLLTPLARMTINQHLLGYFGLIVLRNTQTNRNEIVAMTAPKAAPASTSLG
jgi:hypothetical protein